MRDVIVDVRCLQTLDFAHPVARTAFALLRHARPALAGHALVGLADPALPALPPQAASLLDGVRGTAYTGALTRPALLVQLSPLLHDPLFVARLLLHPAIPAAALLLVPSPPGRGQGEGAAASRGPRTSAPALERAIALRWLARYDLRLAVSTDDPDGAARFWSAVTALGTPAAPAAVAGRKARIAVLTPLAPEDAASVRPLCAALGEAADLHLFTPTPDADTPSGAQSVQPLTALPLLSARFDRVLGLVANTTRHAPVIAQLARHGGACLLEDPCLLAPYYAGFGAKRAEAVAGFELGRTLRPHEAGKWAVGDLRSGALFLGELAAAAEPMIVPSRWVAEEVGRRHGHEALVLPTPIPARATTAREPGTALIAAFGLRREAASCCIWALEWLQFWGVPARLHLVGAVPDGWAGLHALCVRLGVEGQVALMPERSAQAHVEFADVGLHLALRGHGRRSRAAADAAGQGLPCVVSAGVAEGFDLPAWVRTVPDEPSPPLLAEAIAALLDQGRPGPAAARDDWTTYAARLCRALGVP